MHTRRVTQAAAAGVVVIATSLALAACGSSEPATTSTPSTTTMETTMETTSTTTTTGAAITGGATVLVLDATTAKVLDQAGITVAPAPGSTTADGGVSFPVTEGSAPEDLSAGMIDHSGGLVFANAKGTSLTLTNFRVDLQEGTLTATTPEGTTLPLLTIDAAKAKVTQSAKGDTMATGVRGTLTAEAATTLNDTFNVSTFVAGLPMGILALELQR